LVEFGFSIFWLIEDVLEYEGILYNELLELYPQEFYLELISD